MRKNIIQAVRLTACLIVLVTAGIFLSSCSRGLSKAEKAATMQLVEELCYKKIMEELGVFHVFLRPDQKAGFRVVCTKLANITAEGKNHYFAKAFVKYHQKTEETRYEIVDIEIEVIDDYVSVYLLAATKI